MLQRFFIDWENRMLDYSFMSRDRLDVDPKIVLIDIDDKSIAGIGRWPWDRH